MLFNFSANTTGASWDFGTVPYVPVPQQWLKRFRNLDYARRAWGVENFYDNHHYGWQPSVVTDLGKAFFWAPQCDPEEMIRKIAVRDYGTEAADTVVKVWELWSEGMDQDYVASNEEQYGPMRPGPSYPLIFHPNITRTMAQKEIDFPADEGAHFGGQIIKTFYQPYECSTQSPGFLRFPLELAALKRLYRKFTDGVEQLKALRSVVPARKLDKLEYLINLGSYIASCTLTTCHVKEWYMLNVKLLASDTREQALGYLDKLEAIALAEIKNAESAMPLVQKDSRLGWEPSMEYVTDVWHLEWKIRQVNTMLDGELRVFREMVKMQA